MSGFGIFCLLVLIAFLCYFFIGMLIMYVHGARGIELVPHYEFWTNLPGTCLVNRSHFLPTYAITYVVFNFSFT